MSKIPKKSKAPSSFFLAAEAGHNEKIKQLENGLLTPIQFDGLAIETYNIQERMKRYHVPGVSMALIENGEIVWAKAWGICDVISAQAVNTETVFQAASMSKPVAAFAAMRMAVKAELALDESINSQLKSWQIPDNELTQEQPVTLRNLLSHTAGTTVHGFAGYAKGEELPTVVELLKGESPANSEPVLVDTLPGSQWRYSGGGTSVVQLAIEDVSGLDFCEQLRRSVLEPCGMIHSTFESPLSGELSANAVSGHLEDGRVIEQGLNHYPELAAAGLWTTPTDLATFVLKVIDGWHGESDALLSEAASKEILTEQASGSMGPWGLGFGLHMDNGKTIGFHHGGANAGFRGMTTGFLDGRGAVVMTNGDGGDPLISEILTATAALYQWPARQAEQKSWIALTGDEQQRYAGTYDMAEGEESYRHIVKPKGQCLSISGPLFPESDFYLQKRKDNIAYFLAPSGWTLSFSEAAVCSPILTVMDYPFIKEDIAELAAESS